jgi:hypothetical protein
MNKKELMWISLTIFVTIIAWLVIDIYQIKRSSDFGNSVQPLSINPELNKKIITILKTKTP